MGATGQKKNHAGRFKSALHGENVILRIQERFFFSATSSLLLSMHFVDKMQIPLPPGKFRIGFPTRPTPPPKTQLLSHKRPVSLALSAPHDNPHFFSENARPFRHLIRPEGLQGDIRDESLLLFYFPCHHPRIECQAAATNARTSNNAVSLMFSWRIMLNHQDEPYDSHMADGDAPNGGYPPRPI